jgi:hypothetical protein
VLDSYKSYKSVEFEDYCKANNIITLYLSSYLSYIIQSLDIEVFSSLKKIYSSKINIYSQVYINHITKVEFFQAFYNAYKKAMTKNNITRDFQSAGLIPFKSEAVLSKLDVKLQTLLSTGLSDSDTDP